MLRQCTPVLVVRNVADAAAWFTAHLGFEVPLPIEGRACLQRDRAAIRLVRGASDRDFASADSEQSCHIDCDDVDAFFHQHRAAPVSLPKGHIRPPFDQPYGQREFHVIYESLQIVFGMPSRKDTTT